MSAGLVQLVARGPQDAILTGNPQITFFKQNHVRYTHFSSATTRQNIEGRPTPGSISTINIEKKADLLGYIYLTAQNNTGVVPYLDWTSSIIDKVEFLLGGQVVDEQDSVWSNNIEPIVGAVVPSQARLPSGVPGTSTGYNSNSFYPLKFFFCKNWSSVLPLVALKFFDVTIRITWSKNLQTSGSDAYQYVLWMNTIFLDENEREFFATKPMTMLVTQVQRQIVDKRQPYMDLTFAHPVKYLAFQSNSYTTVYSTGTSLQFKTQINGVDACDFKSLNQWVDVTQYYHTPTGFSATVSNVAIIPFCLNTSSMQPTGTLNFSRLDIFRIVTPDNQIFKTMTQTADNLNDAYVYAVNYNFLRIADGVASLLYAT